MNTISLNEESNAQWRTAVVLIGLIGFGVLIAALLQFKMRILRQAKRPHIQLFVIQIWIRLYRLWNSSVRPINTMENEFLSVDTLLFVLRAALSICQKIRPIMEFRETQFGLNCIRLTETRQSRHSTPVTSTLPM